MMIRMKIWTTILAIYEIVAIVLLHCTRTCDAMFGTTFCNDHVFKYFIWCAAVPLLALIIAMWIREIFVGGRRRRFMHRAGTMARDMFDDVKDRVAGHVTPQEVEGLITAAVLMGIKKLSEKFPNAAGNLRRAMRDNNRGMNNMDDMDDDSDDMPRRSARPAASHRTTSARRKK